MINKRPLEIAIRAALCSQVDHTDLRHVIDAVGSESSPLPETKVEVILRLDRVTMMLLQRLCHLEYEETHRLLEVQGSLEHQLHDHDIEPDFSYGRHE